MATAGCKLTPLKIDPCMVWPDDITQCHAVPLNQPDRSEYDRFIKPMDVCVTANEYARTQKAYRELFKRCGDRCQ